MRKGPLATALLAVFAVSACKAKDQAMNDDLARDIALASDTGGLSLAPSRGAQMVVSAEERAPEARPRRSPSARSSRAAPHRTPHRDRVAAHHSTEVASIAAPVPDEAPAAQPIVAPTPTQGTADNAPTETPGAGESPRPHPVAVGSYPGSGSGSASTGRGGISIGDVIGAIGAVVIRGGVVDGDHCDPRAERRRRGAPEILVNNRGPVLRGNF